MALNLPAAFAGRGARAAWWALAVLCVVYGLFAVSSGLSELVHLLGLGAQTKPRAQPWIFVIHALSGALAFLMIPIQLHPRARRHRVLHRYVGWLYGLAVGTSALFAILDARRFAVPTSARILFVVIATGWVLCTGIAVALARQGRIGAHRTWMLRSVALSLFFVSFSLWVPGLLALSLPPTTAWPAGLTLSAAGNLAVVEGWLRRSRRLGPAH